MKLKNETNYDSGDLRTFFGAALAVFGGSQDKTIRVTYSRRGGAVGGHASLGGAVVRSRTARINRDFYRNRPAEASYMMISLPGPSYPVPSLHEIAHVFEHELAHNRGLHHGDMSERVMHFGNQKFSFVDELIVKAGFQLRRKEDPTVEYVHYCRVHTDPITRAQVAANVAKYGAHAKTMCPVEVPGPSGWRPGSNTGPWLCGQRLLVKLRKKATAKVRATDHLDAARAVARKALAAKAEKREAHLRMRLDEAETELARLRKRISKLRTKVNYYDRKAAKR